MTEQAWHVRPTRERVYTFTDREGCLYTVTNVPEEIKLPPDLDVNPIENKTLRELLTPRYAIEQAPELPYIFRAPPINDPLLGRLSLEVPTVHPIRYDDGRWGLPLELRKSWYQLEQALGMVSDRLLMLRNTPDASCVNRYEGWPEPSTCGYRRLHPSHYGARGAIRKSREALVILAARCSLALAIWDTATQSESTNLVPAWVPFLEQQGVSSGWLDALNSSAISNFSHCFRVGGIVDPLLCKWLDHVPVMKKARVPIFLRWREKSAIEFLCKQIPILRQFAPYCERDIMLAVAAPPRPQAPSIYKLCFNGEGRPHPFVREVEERLRPKPCGRFQLPGESRQDFLARMATLIARSTAREREGSAQRARRLDRETYAATGLLPKPYTRVYLWTKASATSQELPEPLRDLEYRAEVHAAAVPGLWQLHGRDERSYNALFDEWDLWSVETPADAMDAQEDAGAQVALQGDRAQDIAMFDFLDPSALLTATQNAHADPLGVAGLTNILAIFAADNDILYKEAGPSDYQVVDFGDWYVENRYLSERYGIYADRALVDPSTNYDTYSNDRLFDVFAFDRRPHVTFPPKHLKTYAGWAWAMMQGLTDSPAIAQAWDLSPRCDKFLFARGRVEGVLRAVAFALNNGQRGYAVKYHKDPPSLGWTLVVDSRVLVILLRWIPGVDCSIDAAFELSQIGAPFVTASEVGTASPVGGVSSPRVHLHLSYRRDSYAHNFLDYQLYSQRLLDFLRSGPHAKVALLHGGIVWRIVSEFGRRNEGVVELLRSYVTLGPSDDASRQRILGRLNGATLVEDMLSEEELALIVGVTKVYTDQRNQKEDRSWWPKHSMWHISGMYTGVWNPKNEVWFQRRLDDIRAGCARPLSAGEWRSALGQYRPCAKLAKAVDAATTRAMDKYL